MKDRIPKIIKLKEQDNEDNLIRTMILDPIARNMELLYFIRLLSSMENGNKIVAVNGKWGSGKTFFLKQFQLLCNYCAERFENQTEIEQCLNKYKNEIKDTAIQRFNLLQEECQEFVQEECCKVVYFNAWEYDNNDEPMKSLMYFLIEQYHIDYTSIAVDWKELGKKAIKFLTGIEYGEDCCEKKEPFLDIISNNDIKTLWKKLLDDIISEKCNKLYIVIDDLDRCRPEYAMKMLERLHHFANDDRVVFILGIDYGEISDMIEHFYGYRDSGNRFLAKIVDIFVDLENRQYEDYGKYLGDFIIRQKVKDGFPAIADLLVKVTSCVFEDFHMTLREMARYGETTKYIYAFYDEHAMRLAGGMGNTILKGIVLPYALGLNITNKNEYYKFISGGGGENFVGFIERHKELFTNIGVKQSELRQSFEEIYQFIVCVMNRDKDIIESRDIGDIRLYEETVSDIFQSINYLYDFEMDCD